MPNLRTDEQGRLWCPKLNDEISPNPHNLGGCHHCVFAKKVEAYQDGGTGVVCSLVPTRRFCARIHIYETGDWCCKLPAGSLAEYRNLTGDHTASEVPADFCVPRPTTFMRCLTCAITSRPNFTKGPDDVIGTIAEARSLSTPEQRAHYPRPETPEAIAVMNGVIQANRGWAARHGAEEREIPKPSFPANEPTIEIQPDGQEIAIVPDPGVQ